MINKIAISDVASFDSKGIEIEDLNKVNYVYGGNGVGKTTISNYMNTLANTDSNSEYDFSNCSSDYTTEEEIFVYNQSYLENVIVEKHIPGIFSLGKDVKAYEEQLEELEGDKSRKQGKLDNAIQNLSSSKEEFQAAENRFIEYLWEIYRDKKRNLFFVFDKTAFYHRNNKTRFYKQYNDDKQHYEKLLPQLSEEDLIRRTEKVYDSELSSEQLIPQFEIKVDGNDFSIFKEAIVGKEDLDFSELINSLEIQDWVSTGTDIINEHHLSQCPMCQRKLSDNIVENLENYFDSTYTSKIEQLNRSINIYKDSYSELKAYIEKIKDNYFLNRATLTELEFKLESINHKNEKIIDSKQSSPSTKQELENFEEVLKTLHTIIEEANLSINKHNDIVNNREESKKKVIEEAKIHFFMLTNMNLKSYLDDIKKKNSTKEGLTTYIKNTKKEIKELDEEINKIKDKIAGIEFTANDMNNQLKLYGFHNFYIEAVDDTQYSLVRDNGELVKNSLSEGEKTFISFLYFYHTIIKDKDTRKIVVIDDPISSLDSSILYVVSSIIKQLVWKREDFNIEQIIISTHNTYFHKEITYKYDNNITNFYILRKNNGVSFIKKYDDNPINSSYELLWKELHEAKKIPNSSVPNIMRRILEEYFTFLGNKNLLDLVQAFNEEEQIIADSLIKFAHDGTHRIKDDLYVEQTGETYDKYYKVFEELFKRNEQHAHYKMMVNSVSKLTV